MGGQSLHDSCHGYAHLGLDSCTSEIGFEMEKQIWGGILDALRREQIDTVGHGLNAVFNSRAFGLRDWPNEAHASA